ncbi:MAG TPA: hypothetical protein VKA10_03785 [Prolixibacteraceae bacterium]|nr:hypothetical protein [Prolixibacteraceae bacterium]
MQRAVLLFLGIFLFNEMHAQLVEVRADYTSIGDVQFSAHNNTSAPLYLQVNFSDLENTTFDEPLPYIKLLEPGFNNLFMLQRRLDAEVPRFNYDIKTYRSNPMAIVDLDYPYLIPFEEGITTEIFDVQSIAGFWGNSEPKSWNVTGFAVNKGDKIFASRTGTVVEVAGQNRDGDPAKWYHTWTNSLTVLQPDGTLIVYRNVEVKNKEIEVGERIVAGQYIGNATKQGELILLIFQHSLSDGDPRFIIPQFVTSEEKKELLVPSREYSVVHPGEIVTREMTKKEQRNYRKRK